VGEHPDRVFLVGGLGVDAIKRIELLNREALEKSLDFRFGNKNLLVTFHPVTLDGHNSSHQMSALLDVLSELDDTQLIFTMPNADTGSDELALKIQDFVGVNPNSRVYTSLGQLRYLSCMQFVDGVIGNSSSGLSEAPSMGIGTIDIGDRQKGRLLASSVIHCASDRLEIQKALHRLYSPEFRNTLKNTLNPYGSGGASQKILNVISSHSLDGILKKSFYDLPDCSA
jgi:GDP/UDP-N,N'-diacetylbacillosamine 2-epimerase (hydrolysing)